MSADERRTWLSVAREALHGIPEDLLREGCRVAKQTADHPSKIVPAIMATIGPAWQARKEELGKARYSGDRPTSIGPPPKRDLMDRRGEPMSEAETAELNRILEWSGAKVRYRPDGSREEVA